MTFADLPIWACILIVLLILIALVFLISALIPLLLILAIPAAALYFYLENQAARLASWWIRG